MGPALVLAGNSFLGRHLCGGLRRAGYEVVATARTPGGTPWMIRCDLTREEAIGELVGSLRPSWVFQCAAVTHSNEPGELYRLHVDGSLYLLRALARHVPDTPVLFLGSAAEYGPVPPDALPIRETHPAAPTSFFGASKLGQTATARAAAVEWNLRTLVVRPFNILGSGLPGHYFAAALAERLRRARAEGARGDFPVVNAEATRDFVDVRDVVEALVGLATRAAPTAGSMSLYNVATGRETSILAVAQTLCRLAGDFQAVPAGRGGSRSGIQRSCGDATQLRGVLGWSPRIPWEQSIEDMWRGMA